MKIPPIPAFEVARLEALRLTGILDTPPDAAFDDLARLASFICGTPIALVSLVDEHRQWFKAKVGIDASETPRDVSFCAHAIVDVGEGALFEIRDTLEDERFADNPMVTAGPMVRFYAGAPLMTHDQQALGTLCVVDIVPRALSPEQRAALQALARQVVAQIELRRTVIEVDRLKDEFISTVSHELRTPLTSMRGALGLLEGEVLGSLSAEAMEVVQIARMNTDRLIHLINAILDLAKFEVGKLELSVAAITTRHLVTGAVEKLRPLADATAVELRVGALEGREIRGDEGRIGQVLTNLVSNAIKFSPPRGAVDVNVASAGPGRVRFEVKDRGPGIAAHEIPRLFDKFQQNDGSDSRRRGGPGLGLAMARAIVEQHGGTIGVRSAPGEGSTFWFELPSNEPEPPPPSVSRRSAPDAELRAALAELRAEYSLELPGMQEQLAESLRRARSEPGNTGLLREARSRAHRIHGTAGSYGFASISEAGGRIEDALDALAAGRASPEQAWVAIDAALAAVAAAIEIEVKAGSEARGGSVTERDA